MASNKQKLVLLGVSLVAGLLLCAGPLFPRSPFKPGYATTNGFLHPPAGRPIPEAFHHTAQYIHDISAFLELPAPRPIHIILCRNWNDFRRFWPFVNSRNIGGLTLDTGTVVYITPKLAEAHFDHAEYLRHELTHAVMAQNVPLWRVRQLQQTPWLYEGLPVWIGNQQAYFSHAEFVQFTKSNELLPLFERPDNMRLAYVAWRSFNEWLYRRHGRPNISPSSTPGWPLLPRSIPISKPPS